jgi:hypothetical protein
MTLIRYVTCVISFLKFVYFLDTFAKLRKATISFVMYVRPSVRTELGSHYTGYHEI